MLLIRNFKNQRPTDIMILTWSLFMLILAIAQNRFTYYYGVNVVILTGFLCVWALQRFGIEEVVMSSERA